jgi:hypothetical protein
MNDVLYIAHSNLKEFHTKHAVNEWCFIHSSLKFKRVSYKHAVNEWCFIHSSLKFKRVSYKARCKSMVFYI